ncbi:cytochrome b/b6 domain-containing protein [Roseomonas sp. CAU 1739]|uniref:cytochrome b n=1 Tax=Roseomonas sp. CAU 1739 TaxID=3140364 RepID=UPI00325AB86C
MPLLNTGQGYGSLTKTLHWLVVALFTFQIVSALTMTRLGDDAGAGRDALYNWHKTLGLVALGVALLRLWARRAGELPPWAPGLTTFDRRVVHHAERTLYLAMFVMPVSGFLYVMAGGYGVLFAGVFALPNPIGRWPLLAEAAKLVHLGAAILLGVALAAHLGIVLRHTVILGNRLVHRMLPARR